MTNNLKRAIETNLSGQRVDARQRAEILKNALRGKKVKKKLSAGFVLAFVLVLLTVSALAVAGKWGVMDFLFARPAENAKPFVQLVSCEAENELVQMNIDSALCDGQSLAFDWTITQLNKDERFLLKVEQFTANGEQLFLDDNDNFDGLWFPNTWTKETNVMRDGNNIELPNALQNTDALTVEMVVGVYQPTRPVYVMPGDAELDPELARQKIREGNIVICDPDGWVVEDGEAEDGIACIVGFTPGEGDPFARTELRVKFTVNVASCAAATQHLKTAPVYEQEKFTARYDRAMLTPLGLYLDLTLTPRPGLSIEEAFDEIGYDRGSFSVTDIKGKRLEAAWPTDNAGSGEPNLKYHVVWMGVTKEQLPPQVSLSFLSKDGEPRYIFAASLE